MKPGGHTVPYAVLGHPVGHTLSPPMHNAAFLALGMNAVYLAFDVMPDRLIGVLDSMCDMGFAGANLTVPLKERALDGVHSLHDSAVEAGAINTIQFTRHGMRGYNTDGYGLIMALREAFGRAAEDEEVVVLGSGGAARATALVCARSGAHSITVVARNEPKANHLARDVRSAVPNAIVSVVCDQAAQVAAVRAGTLVIQATSVGLREDDPPLYPEEAFSAGQKFYDLVYSFPETSTMKAARRAGAHAENGLGMLLHQGAKAFEIWTGTSPPVSVMRDALEHAVYV